MTTEPDFWSKLGPVLPVVTIHKVETAVDIAQALLDGGITHLEVTIRSSAALPAIAAIRDRIPEMTVGAGTVLSARSILAAIESGAQFLVTPGTPGDLLAELARSGLPYLPGAATPTEVLAILQTGHSHIKLFPASALGGSSYLRALSEPLQTAHFVPSGGITADETVDYLQLSNVNTVAGSWVTAPKLVAERDWRAIRHRAEEAARLGPPRGD